MTNEDLYRLCVDLLESKLNNRCAKTPCMKLQDATWISRTLSEGKSDPTYVKINNDYSGGIYYKPKEAGSDVYEVCLLWFGSSY